MIIIGKMPSITPGPLNDETARAFLREGPFRGQGMWGGFVIIFYMSYPSTSFRLNYIKFSR